MQWPSSMGDYFFLKQTLRARSDDNIGEFRLNKLPEFIREAVCPQFLPILHFFVVPQGPTVDEVMDH